MLSIVHCCGLIGVNGIIVNVEIDVTRGMPNYFLVGLPDAGVKESRERVYSAIKNSQFDYPMTRVTINMAPADLRKEGSSFDLAIAIGLLISSGQIFPEDVSDVLFLGELSLSGDLKGISGVLPMVLAAKEHGFKRVIIPYENRDEAAIVDGVDTYPMKNLLDVAEYLTGTVRLNPYRIDTHALINKKIKEGIVDFSEIKGQENAKRALTIAAAGAHNVLMSGPPGAGKSMLAKAFSSILPDLTLDEALEITKIYSISGLLKENHIVAVRPFRSPHHTISNVSLIGGGSIPKPGEVSLAHLGVLYLDELPEFQRSALEVLRQPMEDKAVTISRINATLTFPASFTMIASMNPCPCGYYGDKRHSCTCNANEVRRYQSKISGPLLDRIDIRIDVPSTQFDELETKIKSESSESIKKRINIAREIQNIRYQNETGIYFNSQLTPKLLGLFCALETKEKALMRRIYEKMNLSARGYHRILKLARTIADLDGDESIREIHLMESIQYRTS